jgi:hypothetical protein
MKTTMGTGKKVWVIHNLDKMMADDMLHSFSHKTCGRDGSVSSCKRGVLPRYENVRYNCFSPGRGECVFILHMVRRKPLEANQR